MYFHIIKIAFSQWGSRDLIKPMTFWKGVGFKDNMTLVWVVLPDG